MKKDIHPNYKPFTIIMTDGTKFLTNSAAESDTLHVDVDFRNHPAWTGAASQLNTKANKVAKFNDKFAALGALTGSKKAEEPKEENKEDNQ